MTNKELFPVILYFFLSALILSYWFRYLRYKIYARLSSNSFYFELLFCVLCAGFWVGNLTNLLLTLFSGSFWVDFVKGYTNVPINTFVYFLIVALSLYGGYFSFYSSKIGELFRTKENHLMSLFWALMPHLQFKIALHWGNLEFIQVMMIIISSLAFSGLAFLVLNAKRWIYEKKR